MARQAVQLGSQNPALDLNALSFPSSKRSAPIKIDTVVDTLHGLVSPHPTYTASIESDIEIRIGPAQSVRKLPTGDLFTPLQEIRLTAARQSLLCAILRTDSAGRPQTTSLELEDIQRACRLIIDGHWGPPRPNRWEWGHQREPWRDYFHSHYTGPYSFYLAHKNSQKQYAARTCVENLENALKPISTSRDPHLRRLIDQLPDLYHGIEKYRGQLITAGIGSPPSYCGLYPGSSGSPFRTFRQYQESVREKMQNQPQTITNFSVEVAALLNFVNAADFIYQAGLRPVSLVGRGATSFSNLRNPWLGHDTVVPFSFKFLEDKPITLFTGDNGAGKSKALEALFFNWLYAQSIGFAYCTSGRIGDFRTRFVLLGAEASNLAASDENSRGEREIARHIEFVAGDVRARSLLVLDEFLTSTDPAGALAIALASLEANADAGGYSLVSLHNPATENLTQTTCAKRLQLLRPHPRKKYQWQEGVARADVLKLAKRFGLPENQGKRAAQILAELKRLE